MNKTIMRFLPMIFCGMFLLFSRVNIIAQNRFTISGIVKDEATGEALIGATINIKELPGTGVATNDCHQVERLHESEDLTNAEYRTITLICV